MSEKPNIRGPDEIIELIIQRVRTFLYCEEESDVPQLLEELESYGIVPNIDITFGSLQGDWSAEFIKDKGINPALFKELSEPNPIDNTAGQDMGLTVEEVDSIRLERRKEEEDLLVTTIRETSPLLSLRIRNWMCGFIKHNFPEITVDFPEIDVNQTRDHILNDNLYWHVKVDEVIEAALLLPNSLDILGAISGNMLRLQTRK